MKKFISCLLILIFLILPGCGLMNTPQVMPPEDDEQVEITPEPTIIPQKGGELTLSLTAPDTFNPLLTQSRDMLNFLNLIFESLVAYDEDQKPVPSLASSWETSPDGRLWIFHMREDVKWHNGQTLTAEDVIFTFQALRSGMLDSFYQKNIFENNNILEIGLRNEDPYTLFVRLAEPSYLILDILTFPVLPKDIYQSPEYMLNTKEDFNMIPVGSGPYRVDSTQPYDGNTLKLVRNNSWWKGTPYIDSITAKVYETNEDARNAFANGEVDLVDTMVVHANTYLVKNSSTHYKYLTQNYEFLAFNNEHPLFADKNIRKAIAYAIDRKDIISKVYLNNAETVDVPVPSNSWLYDSTYRIYDYDAERARTLLANAGWTDSDGDGIMDRTLEDRTEKLTFTILTNSDNDFRKDTAYLIAQHLNLVGFDVQVETVSWEELLDERIQNRQFDMILTGCYLDYVHDLRFAFHSGQIGNELNNFIGYQNLQMDEYLDQAAKAYTAEDRREAYKKIQEHLVEELPVISLYFRTGSLLVDNDIQGIGRMDGLSLYRNIKEWHIVR
jgi:peptide/nickel transport system substrate-binding protein